MPLVGQRARQVDLATVDGEDPAPLPRRSGRRSGEDFPVQPFEGGLVELVAGLADRGCRRRLLLRQRNAGPPALVPKLAQRRAVALAPAGGDEAEDEQDDQQAVDDPAAPAPFAVLAGGDRHGRVDDALPAAAEAPVGAGRATLLRRRLRSRRLLLGAVAAQDLAAVLRQRKNVDALARLALAAGGFADAQPVGGPVAGGPEATLVNERLAQRRTAAVRRLPVVGQPAARQAQRMAGQILHRHPGQHQEPRIHGDEVPAPVADPVAPADPAVPARQGAGRRFEQHASQPPAGRIEQEVADVLAEGPLVAEIVVAVDEGVPELPPLRVGDDLQAHRPQLRKRRGDLRLRIRGRGPDRLAAAGSNHALPLRRQLQDAVLLEMLQHPHAGADLVRSLRRLPAEVLADRLAELAAAVAGKKGDGFLDLRYLPAAQAPPGEGRRLQLLDSWIHASPLK